MPPKFERTGVFATDEETKEMQELATEAANTPVMMVGSVDLSGAAWDRAMKRIYELAKAHGLPEVHGYYGFDPEA